MYSWYKILCFEVQPGMWESDRMLQPFFLSPEYRMKLGGTKWTHDYMIVCSLIPLPLWLVGGEGEAGYPNIVLPLTREEASTMSLDWFPEHDETYFDPMKQEEVTRHVLARDVTKEWPDENA